MDPAAELDRILDLPRGRNFRIERRAGAWHMGDPASWYAAVADQAHLTFDIGNNQALANVGSRGELKALTIYRDSYRGACNPGGGWPGVWLAKDLSSYGPYAYSLTIDGITHDLSAVDWDVHTALVDNIIPVSDLFDPQGRFRVRLLTFAPVAAAGGERVRGIVYLLRLVNTSAALLAGTIHLPRLFADGRPKGTLSWAQFDPYEFEVGMADGSPYRANIPFTLAVGASLDVPLVMYMPGEPAPAQVARRGVAEWLAETLGWFRRVLGRVETADGWLGEWHERQMVQVILAVAMSGSGAMAGSNWGSYPATRQIWAKDCYYSCLPVLARDPELARKMILWFHANGMRHPGEIIPGGIIHSTSLSVASVVMAGLYWEQTADREFFAAHPHLADEWCKLLDALAAARQDPDTWLFPSRYLSDGLLESDWHTGSNICAWRAFASLGRMLAGAYGDPARAAEYTRRAGLIRAAIMARTVVIGTGGARFVEGVQRRGGTPLDYTDGEESDTTLAAWYGLLERHDPLFQETNRWALSAANRMYNPATGGITWADDPRKPVDAQIPLTTPSLARRPAMAMSGPLFGDDGCLEALRRITDADGSLWWWPYGWKGPASPATLERGLAKAGWTSGVLACIISETLAGVRYDAPERCLSVAPSAAMPAFAWQRMPFGRECFDVVYDPSGEVRCTNHTCQPVKLAVTFPGGSRREATAKPGATISIRGEARAGSAASLP